MTEAFVEKLNLKTRLGYGIGDIAICLYWSGVGLYLLYFYTDVVGISPSLAGLIYGIGMFWDAITDPFMGYVAERTRTKWGVYRPYLLFGNVLWRYLLYCFFGFRHLKVVHYSFFFCLRTFFIGLVLHSLAYLFHPLPLELLLTVKKEPI